MGFLRFMVKSHAMKHLALALFALLAHTALAVGTGEVIRTAADLADATRNDSGIGRPFELTATFIGKPDWTMQTAIADASGGMIVSLRDVPRFCKAEIPPGTAARLSGRIELGPKTRRPYPECKEIEVLSHGRVPDPTPVTGKDVIRGKSDFRYVRVSGIVKDASRDPADPNFTFLIINSDGEDLLIPIRTTDKPFDYEKYIGSHISVTGVPDPSNPGGRRYLGRIIIPYPADMDGNIRILTNVTDPFDVPVLRDFNRIQPETLAQIGLNRIEGHILAVWEKNNLLLKSTDGRFITAELYNQEAPSPDQHVEISGFPKTDTYNLILFHALWHPLPETDFATEPEPASARVILQDAEGRSRIQTAFHGKAVRIRGTVRILPSEESHDGRFYIESDGLILPIDIGSIPEIPSELKVGCKVEISGICVVRFESWSLNNHLPKAKDAFVVVRNRADIRILSYPSWWTAERLTALVSALVLLLIGIIFWNATLQRKVRRREAALATEITARVASDIKVYERTRLAVELHDSLAQNLTGVALEIKTAGRLAHTDPRQMGEYLNLAAKTLESSRTELRNCLWDLRCQALEAKDMDGAIRQSLGPLVNEATFAIRFNVPRERLSDNATHALLRIIRELVSNAIRHGHARTIRIAGSIENGQLLFSVRDDGCGFDPDTCPNVDQGHFGLQGIRERIKEFDGEIEIASAAGSGTRVEVRISIPHDDSTGGSRL